MGKKIWGLIILILLLSTAACGKREQTQEERQDVFQSGSSENTEENSGFDENNSENLQEDTEYEEMLQMVGVSIKDDKMNYIYDGNAVHLEFQYEALGSKSFGIMILCDGIAVPFTTGEDSTERYLHILPTAENGACKDVDLYFTPIGKKGDLVSVETVDIVEPDFDISQIDDSNIFNPWVYGKKYWVRCSSGINVDMKQDGKERNVSISEDFTTEDIPQALIESSITVREDGTVDNELEYFHSDGYVNGSKSGWLSVDQGEKVEIKITYYGTKGQDIYTGVYLNRELYPVFDGHEYSKAYIDAEHYTTILGEIDTSKLEKGKYICYGVYGNVIGAGSSAFESFILEVK